jgi:hypothetical protein
MERPNTVSGLIQKRRELVARLKLAQTEAKSLVIGIDAVDATLKLFGADYSIDNRPKRLPTPHPAAKGEFQRAAFDLLRETGKPITSLMVAQRFCGNRNLNADDVAFKFIRYRASSCLCNMRERGMICRVGTGRSVNASWELVEGFDPEISSYGSRSAYD